MLGIGGIIGVAPDAINNLSYYIVFPVAKLFLNKIFIV